MNLWLDQVLPRRLCEPIAELTGCEVRHVGIEYASDEEIFLAARSARAAVLTKDSDFVTLMERLGTPPQPIWLRCGNCSNRELERILTATLAGAVELLKNGEPLVEVTGAVRSEP